MLPAKSTAPAIPSKSEYFFSSRGDFFRVVIFDELNFPVVGPSKAIMSIVRDKDGVITRWILSTVKPEISLTMQAVDIRSNADSALLCSDRDMVSEIKITSCQSLRFSG